MKYAHQNVAFEAVDLKTGRYKVVNRFYFTNLRKYDVNYELRANGSVAKRGKVALDVSPQATAEFVIPVTVTVGKPGVEYFVHFSVVTRQAEPLIPIGHEIAQEQFRLPLETEKILMRHPEKRWDGKRKMVRLWYLHRTFILNWTRPPVW